MNNIQPNIILIMTDQQSADMMSCTGNQYLETPNMDKLASSGIRFEKAYCTNPVCVPSRFSLMTGRMPSEINMRSNDSSHIERISEHIKNNTLGTIMKNAGYEVAYGGKEHIPKMSAEEAGFNYLTSDERGLLPGACADFIRQERDKPFFLVASFINPHDICLKAIRDFATTEFDRRILENCKTALKKVNKAIEKPDGISEKEFFDNYCPPLPDNFEIQYDEPEAIQYLLDKRPFRRKARENYSEREWRMHRWAYCRLTEMVDKKIGQLLDAVYEKGIEDNTVIIFTSDHGDMDSAHRLEHKTVFYEEASRIPLIVSGLNKNINATVDSKHLISNGLDIFPTVCDYAGVAPPSDLQGISFKELIEGEKENKNFSGRDYLPVENEIGKMIVTGRYKYMKYDKRKSEEQFFDLKKDPGEMEDWSHNDNYREVISEHRELFKKVFC